MSNETMPEKIYATNFTWFTESNPSGFIEYRPTTEYTRTDTSAQQSGSGAGIPPRNNTTGTKNSKVFSRNWFR